MSDELNIRIHGDFGRPTLIYLPGMHGDWTLVSSFRAAIARQVRFVEFAYPGTTTWSLGDYAGAIEERLQAYGIRCGWLLGESFGSQPAWQLVERDLQRENADEQSHRPSPNRHSARASLDRGGAEIGAPIRRSTGRTEE